MTSNPSDTKNDTRLVVTNHREPALKQGFWILYQTQTINVPKKEKNMKKNFFLSVF